MSRGSILAVRGDDDRELMDILDEVLAGNRLSEEDAFRLFSIRDRRVWDIARAADECREAAVGNQVTYVRNQNINVTNYCINSCGFCGFSRKPGEEGGYCHDLEVIREKAAVAKGRKVTEICSVSGLHPGFDAESYVQIFSAIREGAPGVHIHASNPMEVAYAAKKSGVSTREVLRMMKDAGLGSLCGTAAEILVDEVRKVICPGKVSTDEWVRIIKEAHRLGIRSTATIMYGHCETIKDRVRHLSVIRDIQDETRGFTEFVPLSFIHMNTPLFRKGIARAGATGREDLLMTAVSRLFLDTIDHIQVSWVKTGVRMAQLGLLAGADDLGGTMFEESISKGAGALNTDYLDPSEMDRITADIGRSLRQRDTLYNLI
ncbi:MAG TPA: 5-amino-6-(D-ribitylamino)uracil--L-tyrosine 4-hydroxyphenyl transferase CofH [Methanoregulaceae archaeon]|nr:MAG: 5-amino-6-(D-ribitylamino)uracil--L-tyrosine 4-hydroxyphenyl transferase CofH [Methanolinea sp.]HON80716.1 5-amino-6-(D-ribitylamino)uracil--L-tyrosine 4-hydroxyphenyl transferase CofH [Methanoregulaceae archaeon]HPD09451.1 5-amino-6-(D-ribitylamino)uracil--L-tyrosine 4-hydroxyphenyl transferase CofH [Methanoregulaceae archaeon]HRT14757.1 5-amino-6-(D-ribitylamino)uracil--L-tyrosine 4-hydroxyphenyl transferase CofH [Methanoregulaceae archaeon]HRU30330.1 5-amino-6-(D-ribitylamino)uracil-